MLLPAYTAALFPEPYRVLGRVLQPLTIGHGLLLARIESPFTPFTSQAQTVGAGDILTAVNICCRPWAEGFDLLSSRRWTWTNRLWNWRVCHTPGADARLSRAANLLAAYINEGCTGPRSWVKADASPSKAPILITLKTALQEWLGSDPATAMGTPIAVALMELSVYGERHGALELVSDEEADVLQKLREQREGFSA